MHNIFLNVIKSCSIRAETMLSSDHPSHYKVKPKGVMLKLFEILLGLTSDYDDHISAHMLP